VDVVSGLPSLVRCSDSVALFAAVVPPQPDVASAVDEARSDLAIVEARLELDLRDGLEDRLDGLLTRAHETGYRPLVAEVELARGQLATTAGRHEAAAADMEKAYLAALAAGDDHLAATIAAKLAFVVGVRSSDLDAGRAWLGHAEALESRLDGPPALRAARYATLGVMQYREGKLGPARESLSTALALRREQLGERHPETFALVNNLGAILAMSGMEAEANDRFQQAAGLAAEAYGEEHPITTAARMNLGNIALRKAQYEEARRIFDEVIEVRERVLGHDHPDLGQVLNNLGVTLEKLGRYEEALGTYAKSIECRKKALGDDHVDLAPAVNNMASTLVRLGRHEEARARAREATALWRKHLGEDNPSVAQSFDIEGLALLGLGRADEAVKVLVKARALLSEEGDPLLRAEVNFSLARAWWAVGKRTDAVALAREVANALKDRPDHATAVEVAAWLSQHAPQDAPSSDP
jgi:tetratricopeptide (TPR) repeat protein